MNTEITTPIYRVEAFEKQRLESESIADDNGHVIQHLYISKLHASACPVTLDILAGTPKETVVTMLRTIIAQIEQGCYDPSVVFRYPDPNELPF